MLTSVTSATCLSVEMMEGGLSGGANRLVIGERMKMIVRLREREREIGTVAPAAAETR